MTEKQKMLNGDFYDSRDAELLQIYHRARKLLKEYNNLDSTLLAERERILNELFEFKGDGAWIEAPFFCDYGENISIGKNTMIFPGVIIGAGSVVTKNIPDNILAYGNPCEIKRQL